MAYSEEQGRTTLETFIRFGHSYADTIAELGHPNRGTLRIWCRDMRGSSEDPQVDACADLNPPRPPE